MRFRRRHTDCKFNFVRGVFSVTRNQVNALVGGLFVKPCEWPDAPVIYFAFTESGLHR